MEAKYMELQDVVTTATTLYTLASIIVRLTPTKKDDRVLSKISRLLGVIFKASR
jgi:hypothetical protein